MKFYYLFIIRQKQGSCDGQQHRDCWSCGHSRSLIQNWDRLSSRSLDAGQQNWRDLLMMTGAVRGGGVGGGSLRQTISFQEIYVDKFGPCDVRGVSSAAIPLRDHPPCYAVQYTPSCTSWRLIQYSIFMYYLRILNYFVPSDSLNSRTKYDLSYFSLMSVLC